MALFFRLRERSLVAKISSFFATRALIFFFFFFQNFFPHSRNAQITPTQKHTTKMFSTAKTFTTSTASLRATSSTKVQSKKTFIVRNQNQFFFFFFLLLLTAPPRGKRRHPFFFMITLSLSPLFVSRMMARCVLCSSRFSGRDDDAPRS